MAFAVPASSNVALTASDTAVFTKPTDTAAGNLLFVHIGHSAAVNSVPSGWSLVITTGAGAKSSIYYKLATDSEPADYTFGFASSANRMGVICRVTGGSSGSPVASNGEFLEDEVNPSFNATVTPTTANSGLFFFVYSVTQANAIGGYAVATDDPTWAEAYEHNNTDDLAMAFATRAATS